MESLDIIKLLDLEGHFTEDEHIRNPLRASSPPFDPSIVFSGPPIPDVEGSPSSNSTISPALTEEDEAHIDNLLFWGIDSPALPPGFDLSPKEVAEFVPDLIPLLQQFTNVTPIMPSALPPLVSSASLFSPIAAPSAVPSVSPPARKRRLSPVAADDLQHVDHAPQEPALGPSSHPRAKRPRTEPQPVYAGQSSFQLDPTVAPLQPVEPVPASIEEPRTRGQDYSACRCPGGLTSKPARHWRSCPYNPDRGIKKYPCSICGERFTRKDNRDRHVNDYH
ncbi:hypothetical protein FRB90_011339 [Tulasnella sp. 427]|nr:hypothetical protein FRB90_011339 [Tulasnella sp. 427]